MKRDAASRVPLADEHQPLAAPMKGANDVDPRASGEWMTPAEAYREYGQRILRRIRRQNVGPRSAEDLLHDVYVVAIQMRERRKPLASVLGTLLAITRRLLRNYFRKRALHARLGYDCDAAELADDTTSVDDDAEEARQLLSAAFDQMTPHDQALIRLLDLEGMSVEEIASSLGCPVNTMRSRYRRAKDRLVTLLEGLDAGPPPPPRKAG